MPDRALPEPNTNTSIPRRKRPAPEAGQENDNVDEVRCSSTKGSFIIEIHRNWGPIGAARFLDLVLDGAYDGTVIYRTVRRPSGEPEAVQFGFLKNETLRHKWSKEMPPLKDDPQIFSDPNFRRGMVAFAGGGPNTRGTDVFITFMTGNMNGLDTAPWEVPFGIIAEEDLVNVIGKFGGSGDLPVFGGTGPNLGKGYEALKTSHPDIDYLGNCTVIKKEEEDASSEIQLSSATQDGRKCFMSLRCASLFSLCALGVCFVVIRPAVRWMLRFMRRGGKKQ